MVTDVFPGSPSFVPSPASAAPPTNPMRDTWDILGRHVVPKSVNKVIFIRSSVRFPPKKVSSLLISFPCTFSWQNAHGTCLGEWLSALSSKCERASEDRIPAFAARVAPLELISSPSLSTSKKTHAMKTAVADEEGRPSVSPPPPNSLEVLKNIQDEEEKVRRTQATAIKGSADADANDLVCASWARKEITGARGSALATKTIFSHCFVIPWSSVGFRGVYGLLMLFLAIVVQVAVPLIILATQQPIRDLDSACPNQSSYQTKIIGFTLSLYFVVQTVSLCINKLRGLGFLHMFVDLGFSRSLFIKLAILSQFAGMAAAGGAQFLLFIGNADGAFVVLVLQSLAMTFCLTVDQNIVGHQIGTWTQHRLTSIAKDDLLNNGIGIGRDGGAIPKSSFDKMRLLALSEKFVLLMITTTGAGWIIAVTYCM